MLGWSPLFTLEEGLDRTIAWYRDFLAMSDARRRACDSRFSNWCRNTTRRRSVHGRFRSGRKSGARRGPRVRRVGHAVAGRFRARFLADHRPLRGAVRKEPSRATSAFADATLVNSGSSANLLALTALTSPKLGDRRLRARR